MSIKVCIVHNKVCYGSGWKQIKRMRAEDVAKRICNIVCVSGCTECQIIRLRKQNLLKGGE